MTGVLPIDAPPDSECSICMETLSQDVVKMVTCKHVYHCVCILAWFNGNGKQHRRCPNCREVLYDAAPQALHSFRGAHGVDQPMRIGYLSDEDVDDYTDTSFSDYSSEEDSDLSDSESLVDGPAADTAPQTDFERQAPLFQELFGNLAGHGRHEAVVSPRGLLVLPLPTALGGPARQGDASNGRPPAEPMSSPTIASASEEDDDFTMNLDEDFDYTSDDLFWDTGRPVFERGSPEMHSAPMPSRSSATQECSRLEMMTPAERATHERLSVELFGEEEHGSSPATQQRRRSDLIVTNERAIHDRLRRELFGEQEDAMNQDASMEVDESPPLRCSRRQVPALDASSDLTSSSEDEEEDQDDFDRTTRSRSRNAPSSNVNTSRHDMPAQTQNLRTSESRASRKAGRIQEIQDELTELSRARRNGALRPHAPMPSQVDTADNNEAMLSEAARISDSAAPSVRQIPRHPRRRQVPASSSRQGSAETSAASRAEHRARRRQIRNANRRHRTNQVHQHEGTFTWNDDDMPNAGPARSTARIPGRPVPAEAIPASRTPRLARRDQVRASANRRRMWEGWPVDDQEDSTVQGDLRAAHERLLETMRDLL